ncbi:FtsB family cell division protein [Arthrobacter halodurans]|uniref:Septum formation initiator family protein n=1 Tax=Arthrobacter halodurans TaxID=516699 RepID=A0ABV4UT79_9MICC
MATRRPNMPRARAAGQQAGDPRGPRGDEAAKVIPLGAIPDEPAAGASRPARSAEPAAGASRPARSAEPAAARQVRPATVRNGGHPHHPPAAKPRHPAPSEQRLRERAELSGAIRAPKNAPGAGKRPPSGPQQAGGAPVPARNFSGRMLALAVVLVTITVLLLPSVGTYVAQRQEMGELRESIAAKQLEQAELQQQIARWDDPVYIRQQARDRINLVMPGERKYMVIGSAGEEPVPESESPGDVRTDLPWVDALWDTVQRSATD